MLSQYFFQTSMTTCLHVRFEEKQQTSLLSTMARIQLVY